MIVERIRSIMDDITVFATLLALVVTSVGFIAYYNEKEEVDANNIGPPLLMEEKPLPLKEDVLKAAAVDAALSHKKLDDSDAFTAETIDSSDDDAAVAATAVPMVIKKRGLPAKVKSMRWSRTGEPKRDARIKKTWSWRPKMQQAGAPDNVGYEI